MGSTYCLCFLLTIYTCFLECYTDEHAPYTPDDNITVPVEVYKNTIEYQLLEIDTNLVPVRDLANTLQLTVNFGILSLTNFDEISGQIGLVAALNISWQAYNLPKWNISLMGGKKSVTLPSSAVWKPQLVLLNPAVNVADLTKYSERLRITSTGAVEWDVITIIQASFSVDVAEFPFDTQICTLKIAPWGYDSSEIRMIGSEVQGLETISNTENSHWQHIQTDIFGNNGNRIPYLEVSLHYKRKYEYFLVNVLLAPILLSIISPCVFLLPASSGERMSFSITCFLSFSVYLNLISDNMPKSSVPIAHLSYFMMYMLIHSGSVTVSTIVTLRIYHKDNIQPVPQWVQVFVKIVRFRYCIKLCKESTNVKPIEIAEVRYSIQLDEMHLQSSPESKPPGKCKLGSSDDYKVTWFLVGKTLDRLFFTAYLGWMLFTIITFFVAVNVL